MSHRPLSNKNHCAHSLLGTEAWDSARIAYEHAKPDTLVEAGTHYEVGLTRNVGDDDVGLQDRQWAYVADGKLPDRFDYGVPSDFGTKVPARFHAELAAYRATVAGGRLPFVG